MSQLEKCRNRLRGLMDGVVYRPMPAGPREAGRSGEPAKMHQLPATTAATMQTSTATARARTNSGGRFTRADRRDRRASLRAILAGIVGHGYPLEVNDSARSAASKPRNSLMGDLGCVNSTLLYVSDASLPVCDVERLASESAERNLSDHLSGLLCFDGRHFLQYVEGRDDRIQDLHRRLHADSRHTNMETLMLAQTGELLRYPTWDMEYIDCPGERYSIMAMRGRHSADALRAFEALVSRVRPGTL